MLVFGQKMAKQGKVVAKGSKKVPCDQSHMLLTIWHLLGPFSTNLIMLATAASTPAIWIGANISIYHDFVSYLRGDDTQDEEEPSEFGGIWHGN